MVAGLSSNDVRMALLIFSEIGLNINKDSVHLTANFGSGMRNSTDFCQVPNGLSYGLTWVILRVTWPMLNITAL